MQIEVGKEYLTSNGKAVRIVADTGLPEFKFVGYYLDKEESGLWNAHGRSIATNERYRDIIAERTPYHDFKVDEPVMVRDFAPDRWNRRYFAGLSDSGSPLTFADGATSWSTSEIFGNTVGWYQMRRPTSEELSS